MSVLESAGGAPMGVSELKKAVAAKEREVDYKITHFASFADNIEQVCDRDNVCKQKNFLNFKFNLNFYFLFLFLFFEFFFFLDFAK
jgi:hypothetical protein